MLLETGFLKIALTLYVNRLFNKSLTEGVFHSLWKQATVCLIFKKGSKSDKTNSSPISLLSNMS